MTQLQTAPTPADAVAASKALRDRAKSAHRHVQVGGTGPPGILTYAVNEQQWAVGRLAPSRRRRHTGVVAVAVPPMPAGPMLLTAGVPQTGAQWLVEPKLDGARGIARVARGEVTVQSKPGNNLTGRFPEVAAELAERMAGRTAIVDGELVALDEEGLPSFSLLQRRLNTHRPSMVLKQTVPVRLWLFDLLHLDGRDLTGLACVQRRAILEDLLPGRGGVVAVAPPGVDLTPPRSWRPRSNSESRVSSPNMSIPDICQVGGHATGLNPRCDNGIRS